MTMPSVIIVPDNLNVRADPNGNILKTDDDVELAAWYEFTVNL